MSTRTHRGVTSSIDAYHGLKTNYSVSVSYADDGVTITASKHWIYTRSEAEAIVAKYRARWERDPVSNEGEVQS